MHQAIEAALDSTTSRRVNAEAVFRAASALASAGKKPTNAAVRSMLGYGSFSTIAPLLRRWQLTWGLEKLRSADQPASGAGHRFDSVVAALSRAKADDPPH